MLDSNTATKRGSLGDMTWEVRQRMPEPHRSCHRLWHKVTEEKQGKEPKPVGNAEPWNCSLPKTWPGQSSSPDSPAQGAQYLSQLKAKHAPEIYQTQISILEDRDIFLPLALYFLSSVSTPFYCPPVLKLLLQKGPHDLKQAALYTPWKLGWQGPAHPLSWWAPAEA